MQLQLEHTIIAAGAHVARNTRRSYLAQLISARLGVKMWPQVLILSVQHWAAKVPTFTYSRAVQNLVATVDDAI